MTGLAARQRGDDVPQLILREVSAARGLLERRDLLQLLDRAVTKRVTVISAPPGSGKTSLLRAWADRSTDLRRIVFVAVDRGDELVDGVLSEIAEPVVVVIDDLH